MKPPNLKCKDRVEIEWIDADGPGDPKWHDEPDMEEWANREYIVFDVGYVVKATRNTLVLVGGYSEDEETVAQYHREIKIPIGCIRKVRKLK